MTAAAETETADIIAAAYSGGSGDKGYQGNLESSITPFKKPQGGELLDWQKEFNAQVNKLRAPVERAIAHLKILAYSSYRLPAAAPHIRHVLSGGCRAEPRPFTGSEYDKHAGAAVVDL